jgi:RhtB (resistance to homoserine/threonine) family protein
MNIDHFWVFALAALLLNLTPGNDMLYVAARSASQGVKAGIISSLGIMMGCMVHIIAAVVGLSAIIARSATAFDIIKYLGAAYLVYLGIRSMLSKKKSLEIKKTVKPLSYKKIFWQGVITNVLNPKVALFFLAFLPQFININSNNTHWQILFLGTWFNVGGTFVNIAVSLLFGRISKWLSQSPRFVQWQERITGAMLIGLGIKVALSKK